MHMEKENKKQYIDREKKLMELEYEIIQDFVKTRKNQKMTQAKLAQEANLLRETIARIENLMTSPKLNTLIKLLEPMGYTLKIVKLDKKDESDKKI